LREADPCRPWWLVFAFLLHHFGRPVPLPAPTPAPPTPPGGAPLLWMCFRLRAHGGRKGSRQDSNQRSGVAAAAKLQECAAVCDPAAGWWVSGVPCAGCKPRPVPSPLFSFRFPFGTYAVCCAWFVRSAAWFYGKEELRANAGGNDHAASRFVHTLRAHTCATPAAAPPLPCAEVVYVASQSYPLPPPTHPWPICTLMSVVVRCASHSWFTSPQGICRVQGAGCCCVSHSAQPSILVHQNGPR
jgi:hypothetical protein